MMSCFAGLFLSVAGRDLGEGRETFWGVIGFNATPEIKPGKNLWWANSERTQNPGVTAQ
jgi:hypothetical protein